MLHDMMISPAEQLAIEDISSPMAAQILDLGDEDDMSFFADDLPGSDDSTGCPTNIGEVTDTTAAPINATAAGCDGDVLHYYVSDLPASDSSTCCTMAANVTTASASCDSEGLCCYIGDDASFDFDPDTISSLLDDQPSDYELTDVIPAASARYWLPATSLYVGEQNQDELNQLVLTDTIASGSWPQGSPDSVIPPDMDTEAKPGWRPWPSYSPDATVSLPDEQPIRVTPQLLGYAGMDTLPTCSFFDTSLISRYQTICSGEGQMGFLHGRMMMNAAAGLEAASGGVGGVYGSESTQRVYKSIDMQVMDNYKSLVEGCNSNPMALPTSEITPPDDSNLKAARLSPEERKEKIHRYLKKRTERNFKKKIKYACRKTLADSRPRVRGRFAKNDEHGEGTTRPSSSNHEYYDDEEAVVKEEEDTRHSSNIFLHISGGNAFNYNYTLESWI